MYVVSCTSWLVVITTCLSYILHLLLFGLPAQHSWRCFHSRHKLSPFFHTPSFSDMPLYVNLGWSCIIQMMIACHCPAGKDVSRAKTLCAVLWCTCTKLIACHLPSPSFLDSYSAADFVSSSLIEAVVFRNPNPKLGKINIFFSFFPLLFRVPSAFRKSINAQV